MAKGLFLSDGLSRARSQRGIGISLHLVPEVGAVLESCEFPFIYSEPTLYAVLIRCSLAMMEMKYLLKAVYSRFRTKVAAEMMGRMEIADQIISSRPLDQVCKLTFETI